MTVKENTEQAVYLHLCLTLHMKIKIKKFENKKKNTIKDLCTFKVIQLILNITIVCKIK